MITKAQRRRRYRNKVKSVRAKEAAKGNKLTTKEAGQLYESRRSAKIKN